MAAVTDAQLTTDANIIRNETVALANSALRNGNMLIEIIDSKVNRNDIAISTSLGVSDALVPSQKAVKAYVDNLAGLTLVTVKVSLSSAQILALNTTPLILVAAQGAGKMIVPIRIMINAAFNSIAYTTNTNIIIGLNTLYQTTLTSALAFSANQLAAYTLTTAAASATPANSINTDLRISTQTGNPAAGNSTMDVYLTYTVITL